MTKSGRRIDADFAGRLVGALAVDPSDEVMATLTRLIEAKARHHTLARMDLVET